MKPTRILVVIALLVAGAVLKAQRPISVSEDSVSFKGAKYPGLVVTIPEYNYESARKNWVKELQSGTKSKVVTENLEMTIFGAIKKEINPNPMNIYSNIINQDTVLLLTAAFELSKDKFIEKSNGENELAAARVFLKKFAREQYSDKVQEELDNEEKSLKGLKNELESFQDKKVKLQKSIQSNRTDSLQARDNINILNNEIARLSQEIIQQNNQLATMQAGVVRDQKEDYVKSVEKNKKKAYNEVESLSKKIVRLHSENEESANDILKNEADQAALKEKIEQQDLVVRNCREKLARVKAF